MMEATSTTTKKKSIKLREKKNQIKNQNKKNVISLPKDFHDLINRGFPSQKVKKKYKMEIIRKSIRKKKCKT